MSKQKLKWNLLLHLVNFEWQNKVLIGDCTYICKTIYRDVFLFQQNIISSTFKNFCSSKRCGSKLRKKEKMRIP